MADSTEYAIQYIYRILDEYSPALKKIQESTEKMGKAAKEAGEKASRHFKLFGVAVGAIVSAESLIELGKQAFDFGKDCVQAAEKSNVSITLLKNNLSNLGRSKDFEMLEDKANKLSKNTIFSGEQILTGSTQALLRFGNINGKMFDEAQQIALNYTAATYGVKASQEDLANSAQLVGRALETGNIRAFQKMGVVFTPYEQQQLEYLKKTNQIGAMQSIVMSHLQNAPGLTGAMSALTATPEGMEMQIKSQMEMMKVGIGNSLLPLVTQIMRIGVQLLPVVQSAIASIMPGITNFANIIIKVLPFVIGLFKTLWEFRLVILGLVIAYIGYTTALSANAAITAIVKTAQIALFGTTTAMTNAAKIATVAQWLFNVAVAAFPVIAIVIGIGLVIAAVVYLIFHWKEFTKMFQTHKQLNLLALFGPIGWVLVIMAHFQQIKKLISEIPDYVKKHWVALASILMGPVYIAIEIITHWKQVGKVIGDVFNIFQKGGFDKFKADLNDVLKNPTVPGKGQDPVNVNVNTAIQSYNEKGVVTKPYKTATKLGWQAP